MLLEIPPAYPSSKTRRRLFSTLLSLACATSMLGACEDPADEGDSSEDGGDDDDNANVILEDENNYSNTSSLSIPVVETVEGDFEICWGDIMMDLQCHEVDPVADIDAVGLVRLYMLSHEEAEEKLASDTLSAQDRDGYLELLNPPDSCIRADDLTNFGTQVDIEDEYYESEEFSYLLLFNTGTQAGVGARTMAFVEPRASSTNDQVNIQESSCDILDFSANLENADPVSIPADGPWVVSWANITKNGAGNEFIYEAVDGLLIGFYEGLTVADLEAQILDLEQEGVYTAMWDLEIESGRSADLADAVQRGSDEPFDGFDRGEGTWLLGLMCSTCQTPAPLLLAVVDPSGGGE